MSLEQPRRQGLRQMSLLLLTSWRSMRISMSGIFSNPLRLKLWASSTLQLVTSWTILVRGWLSTLARLERPASCISVSRSWYSVMTRCCSTMVSPITPRTDVPLFCLLLLNF